MRNSSLVEWSCAENITGLSIQPKLGYSSENAGMSSENYVGIIMAENLRFPGEGSSAQG